MRVWVKIQLLTLVLTLSAMPNAVASPAKPQMTAPADKVEADQPPAGDGREIDEYNLMPSPPPKSLPKGARDTYYYPFRQALTPRIAAVAVDDRKNPLEYALGVFYLWPRFRQPQAELGVDFLSRYGGHLNLGVRRIFFERNYFRPYYLFGLTHEVVAKDRLATVTNIDNYYVRIAAGMEDAIRLPKSVRLEIEARLGLERMMLFLSLGYSWGF